MSEISQAMAEVFKAEAETRRKINLECIELLYKYGHTFPKEDRDKAIDLIAKVKNQYFSDATIENAIQVAQCK